MNKVLTDAVRMMLIGHTILESTNIISRNCYLADKQDIWKLRFWKPIYKKWIKLCISYLSTVTFISQLNLWHKPSNFLLPDQPSDQIFSTKYKYNSPKFSSRITVQFKYIFFSSRLAAEYQSITSKSSNGKKKKKKRTGVNINNLWHEFDMLF